MRAYQEMRQNAGFTPDAHAIMIEFDPLLNENLFNFESHTSAEEHEQSEYYRELKSAAIQAHVQRHNENIRKILDSLVS